MGRNNRLPEHLILFLSALMAMAYMGGGIALMTSSQSFGILPTGPFRYAAAVLLIGYGLFRAYRAFKRFRERE